MTDTLYRSGNVGHCGIGGSEQAARFVETTVQNKRDRVLKLVEASGATGISAERIADKLGLLPFNITPRLSDLRKAGRIVDSQRRERNSGGVRCIIWAAAEHSQPVKIRSVGHEET